MWFSVCGPVDPGFCGASFFASCFRVMPVLAPPMVGFVQTFSRSNRATLLIEWHWVLCSCEEWGKWSWSRKPLAEMSVQRTAKVAKQGWNWQHRNRWFRNRSVQRSSFGPEVMLSVIESENTLQHFDCDKYCDGICDILVSPPWPLIVCQGEFVGRLQCSYFLNSYDPWAIGWFNIHVSAQ